MQTFFRSGFRATAVAAVLTAAATLLTTAGAQARSLTVVHSFSADVVQGIIPAGAAPAQSIPLSRREPLIGACSQAGYTTPLLSSALRKFNDLRG